MLHSSPSGMRDLLSTRKKPSDDRSPPHAAEYRAPSRFHPTKRPVVSKVGLFDRWPLVLIDLHTDEGIVGRGYLEPYLERSMLYVVPAICDLAEECKGQPIAPLDDFRTGRAGLNLIGLEGPVDDRPIGTRHGRLRRAGQSRDPAARCLSRWLARARARLHCRVQPFRICRFGREIDFLRFPSVSLSPGTQGSNPSPSISESSTNLTSSWRLSRSKLSTWWLAERAAQYAPEQSEAITWVPADAVRRAARLFATERPSCYFTWAGLEMHTPSCAFRRRAKRSTAPAAACR